MNSAPYFMSTQKFRYIAAAIITVAMPACVAAQDALNEQALLGSWQVSGDQFQQVLTFKGNNELVMASIQSKRDGKPIVPITHLSDAAYKFGNAACNVGQESGNLFIARQSERCCFKAYKIGSTLVFDEVQTGTLTLLTLCRSKTLRKAPK